MLAGLMLRVLVLLAATAPGNASLERAEWLFLNRHLQPGYADSALALAGCAPRDGRSLALRARVLCQLGEEAPERSEQRRLCGLARAVADTLRRLDDGNAAGHLWWAAAHGRLTAMQGMLRAAVAAGEVRRELARAVELAPGDALARYALGRLQLGVPGVLGGDTGDAEREFRAALACDSTLTIARLELARVLDRRGRRCEAVAQLDTLLATTDPSHPAEFERHDRPAARALVEKWRGE